MTPKVARMAGIFIGAVPGASVANRWRGAHLHRVLAGVPRYVRYWFTLLDPVDRRAYLATGLGLMAFKYAVDAGAVALATGRFWSPLDYLLPFYLLRAEKLAGAPHDSVERVRATPLLDVFVLGYPVHAGCCDSLCVQPRRAAGLRRHGAGGEPESAAVGRCDTTLRARGPLLRGARAAPGARARLAGRDLRSGDRAPHPGRGRTSRQPGGRDSGARRARRGARPDPAVRGGRLGRGCRTSGGGVAQRGELQ